jgi:cold shock protein
VPNPLVDLVRAATMGLVARIERQESQKETTKMLAKVKWFNEAKGFGFLTIDGKKDAFVHYSAIQGDGFKTLNEGEEVEAEVGEDQSGKGLKAFKVTKLTTGA